MELEEKIIEESKKVKPIMKIMGRDVYTIEDGQKLNRKACLMAKIRGTQPTFGKMEMTDDGMYYKKSYSNAVVCNYDDACKNKMRIIVDENGKEKYEVADDTRAIDEQFGGRVYTEQIKCYVFEIENKKVKITDIKFVDVQTFVKEFKDELDNKSAILVWDAIKNLKEKTVRKTKLKLQ